MVSRMFADNSRMNNSKQFLSLWAYFAHGFSQNIMQFSNLRSHSIHTHAANLQSKQSQGKWQWKSYILQRLTSSDGLCWIIHANHCWFFFRFLAVHLNNPSSYNTPCIPTQLEHICVTVVSILGLYCKAVNMKTNPSKQLIIYETSGEKAQHWMAKDNQVKCVSHGEFTYSISADSWLITGNPKTSYWWHWICRYTIESLLTSYWRVALIAWGLSVLTQT